MKAPVYAFLHHPGVFSSRSGMFPLAEAVGAKPIFYETTWQHLQERSWTVGQWMRRWGQRYYGSEWNSLVPWYDEWRLARRLPGDVPCIGHFLWAEFASPRSPALFSRKQARLVGTFHASATRQPRVLNGYRSYNAFARITLMSETQKPYLLEQGIPEQKLHVILHGVDTAYFAPGPHRDSRPEGALEGLLIGSTERDHAFMAAVLSRLDPDVLHLRVCTSKEQQAHYQDVPNCEILPFVDDVTLLELYRESDLLIMPMLDCTANNALLESMACGTPVLTNAVGGIPEYVSPEAGYVLENKDVECWTETLRAAAQDRATLSQKRVASRAWAERFDWKDMARGYLDVYEAILNPDACE